MAFDPKKYKINNTVTLRDYQMKILEIILYFDHFCREYGLTYYLSGGTCIGAVRHKGFIPWDCDADVFMPRKDYELLGDLWNKYADTDHYAYDRTTESNNMHEQLACIKDNYTTYIRAHNVNYDMNHGIPIDIIPLDGLSDKWLSHQLQKVNGAAFCLFNAQRIPNKQNGMVQFCSKILLSIFRSPKLRYRIWENSEKRFSKYDPDNCKYLGELITGFHTLNLCYPKEWFQRPKELEFEGHYLYGPTMPEKYLEVRYPGFMNYPPVNEQVPLFKPAFIDLNTPYTEYKGIKYYVINKKKTQTEG